MSEITGKTLIEWGYTPGKWFKSAIEVANHMLRNGEPESEIRAQVSLMAPPPPVPLQSGVTPAVFMDYGENEDEQHNYQKVMETFTELVKTPTIRAGAIMPDACPAGPVGTIPVGGVVACEDAIHPGFHSADICCSLAMIVFGTGTDPKKVLDTAMKVTHFGGGGRKRSAGWFKPPTTLLDDMRDNPFTSGLEEKVAIEHFVTQGDGNHFLSVGRLASTGQVVLVTHHGSRKPGAEVFKRGMRCAEKYRRDLCPEVLAGNAWIPADTEDGEDYWNALQLIREWTHLNHCVLHDQIAHRLNAHPIDRFWNEHNFVFRKDDGLFYHAKGATPTFLYDTPKIIPMNMREPILLVDGEDVEGSLGFAPHGAGRNFSRREHGRRIDNEEDFLREETAGLDARFYSGYPDLSELPSAYKPVEFVRGQIESKGLAEVVDEVIPYGCIMAGEWRKAFSKKGKK